KGLGIDVQLRARQHRPHLRAPTRISHPARVVADDQHHQVTRVLEVAQLVQHHHVPEMDVRSGGVDTQLHAQGPPLLLGLGAPAPERGAGEPIPLPGALPAPPGNGKPPRPRLKRLRFALILAGITMLAFVSTVFGMMMAVTADLPKIENFQQYKRAQNSILYDD